MKTQKTLLFMLFYSIACAADSADFSEKFLIGKWACEYEHEEEGVHLKSFMENNFVRGGGLDSTEELRIEFTDEDGLYYSEYLVISADRWRIEDGFLITENKSVRFLLLDDNGLAEFFFLPDIVPEGLTESSIVTVLSDTKMVLTSESDPSITVSCNR